jgi:hypothetical protein
MKNSWKFSIAARAGITGFGESAACNIKERSNRTLCSPFKPTVPRARGHFCNSGERKIEYCFFAKTSLIYTEFLISRFVDRFLPGEKEIPVYAAERINL